MGICTRKLCRDDGVPGALAGKAGVAASLVSLARAKGLDTETTRCTPHRPVVSCHGLGPRRLALVAARPQGHEGHEPRRGDMSLHASS